MLFLRYLKCKHIIVVSERLKLCSYPPVALNIPVVTEKRGPGNPRLTAPALKKQPIETIAKKRAIEDDIIDDVIDEPEQVILPSKRIKKAALPLLEIEAILSVVPTPIVPIPVVSSIILPKKEDFNKILNYFCTNSQHTRTIKRITIKCDKQ